MDTAFLIVCKTYFLLVLSKFHFRYVINKVVFILLRQKRWSFNLFAILRVFLPGLVNRSELFGCFIEACLKI